MAAASGAQNIEIARNIGHAQDPPLTPVPLPKGEGGERSGVAVGEGFARAVSEERRFERAAPCDGEEFKRARVARGLEYKLLVKYAFLEAVLGIEQQRQRDVVRFLDLHLDDVAHFV